MSVSAKIPVKSFPFLVDGEWIADGARLEVRSPFDGSAVGTTYWATREQLERAIAASVRAFEKTRHMAAYERRQILRAISDAIATRKDEFAQLIALEAGKPVKTARAEIERAVFTFEIAADESVRIGGEWIPMDLLPSTVGRTAIVRRFPLGPIAAITPFNFPLNLVAHKIAPAIAAGCTMVLKPAPKTPLTALLLGEVVANAGWPAGALNILSLSNEDAQVLVADDRLKLLTFTGSGAVGWGLKQKAGKKKVVLELGGNAAVIVHGDSDVDYAAERCTLGGFSYAGQSCISVQRIFVQRTIEEKFTSSLLARVAKLKTGNPTDESTDIGPMINEDAAKRAVSWIEEAVSAGAKLLAGGERRGGVVEPTVLTHTKPQMRVNCEEVFAPVVVIEPYDNFTDALRRVNDSPYGLQAGLFTRDAKLIFQAYETLEVGGLMVGEVSSFRVDHMPYGGIKDSGLGREGLRYSIEEMTEPRLLVLNLH
ncbi:MAG TPA: aldehyde dehydrogenase family protein [Candidatus Acidoferrales bacterium]|nr:aldehyde dehydrogenase family protein [Candidatus Acidoferrales bacterium]